jgi:Outer membrane protein beta-barrel domain
VIRRVTVVLLLLLIAAPTFAQVDVRPFGLVSVERFSASTTIDATLGSSFQPMWGGGVEVGWRSGVFLDAAVSRLSRNGHRAFIAADTGEVSVLTTPLHAALTPFELTIGRRFPVRRTPTARRRGLMVVPYVGGGVGIYRYDETSDSSSAGEDFHATHVGFLAVGGAEFRVSKWIGIAADAQYTRVPGILGHGGVSQDADEHDLGGIAGRVRVILGK